MQQKPEKIRQRKDHKKNAVVVKEYAYQDTMNYPIRQQQEDSYFAFDDFYADGKCSLFGVLDGHGGCDVVQYATEHIPEEYKNIDPNGTMDPFKVFPQLLEKIEKQLVIVGAADQGTCCCLVLIRIEGNQKVAYVANLGDTRAVLDKNGKAERVSTDHKATNQQEQDRIKKDGGIIIRNRVSGQLAVTRALGDLDLKTEGVIITPDIKKIELEKDDNFIIIASDGLWDVVDDQQAVTLQKSQDNIQNSCAKLVEEAIQKNSRDNISVLVIRL
ncbi:Protein phosphatase 2C (PP2C)-like domain [Pseudocohnilembus persalinus]|uniref:protein-serine/threonine phosphatase n=1 Tax=Pseudocohnilembus persalinus TaxID=266149 RepID=A0A0V0R0E3_PSEPJ|nr:Protein phosphatase 2C (PP2C)-like domain [Pseudocohnilembus persalinus]|eukprot:KRX07971.1 Protein phosphatase 2C (PP2C)-like domain [Pseudocohnilembus persalinus]